MEEIEDLKQTTIQSPLLEEPPERPPNELENTSIEEQSKCQDSIFAVIFLIHFLSILFIVFEYGVPAITQNKDKDDIHYRNYLDYIKLSIFSCGLSFLVTCIFKMILTRLALRVTTSSDSAVDDRSLVLKYALGFTMITSMILVVSFYILDEIWLSILSLLFFVFSVCYGYILQSQMTFASTNLALSIRAIRSNGGLTIVAHIILCLGIFYIGYWIIAMIGLYEDSKEHCERNYDEGVICQDSKPRNVDIVLLFLNFYWAQQVIKNIIHVVTTGTIHNWWFGRVRGGFCCSRDVSDSLFQSMTYSFGSICLGSLLVTIIYILRLFLEYIQDDMNELLCCTCQCLNQTFQTLYKKFNKWGYVYVGMYGYPFTTSSEKALDVLERRGWGVIMNDDLITNVIGLVICMVGLTNGMVVFILLDHYSWFDDEAGNWRYVIFT